MKDFLKVLLVIVVLLFCLCACQDQNKSEKMIVIGQDPQAFTDARVMFRAAPISKLSPEETAQLLEQLTARINSGALPESADSLKLIYSLENTGDFNAVYEKMLDLSDKAVQKINRSGDGQLDANLSSSMSNAETSYKQGKYPEAVSKYTSILQKSPGNLDARNNLGLAEMHQGHNLTALVHFRMVSSISPTYYGAVLNQGVALQRLGLPDKAYQVCSELIEKQQDLPMAYYNLAWLENSRGMFNEADTHLEKALKMYSGYAKAAQLSALNNVENGFKIDEDQLKALPGNDKMQWSDAGNTRAQVINDGVQVMNANTPLTVVQKGFVFTVAQTNGEWVEGYFINQGVKQLGWIPSADVKIINLGKKHFAWWWWWFGAIIGLYIIIIIRGNRRNYFGAIGFAFISIVFVAITGILYGVFWQGIQWLGWTIAVLGTLPFLILARMRS